MHFFKLHAHALHLTALALLTWPAGPLLAGVTEGREAFGKFQYADARKELAEPATQGDAEAMALMGEMLMRGLGGTRDELKARDYILQAHEKGFDRATYTLGNMYLFANLVGRDEVKGVAMVRQAAEKGYPPAQAAYGAWISNGLFGLEKNDIIALGWIKLAADQKDPSGMSWMGHFYETGKAGLTADNLVALDWYKKAAELRNSSAMLAAGRFYAVGRGVAPDGAEALRWLRMAASLSNYTSYNWIASVYEFGRGGIAKNPTLAYAWYGAMPANASPVDLKSSIEGKERLAKTMSPTDIEEANKQAKTVVAQNMVTNLMSIVNTSAAASASNRKGVYGSGVVVSRNGDIVTNEHVVQNCDRVRVQPQGTTVKVIAKDAKNDLALLRLESGFVPASRVRAGRGIRLGDDLVAIGYPLRGILSSGPVVTTGIVNAMSGANNDTSAFQMSATVQPGSSGGPIFDNSGLLVGIVRSRLLPTGPMAAQNVNFGINLATVSGFLDAHAVDYATSPVSAKTLSVGDITALAQKSTVQIECY